MPESSPVHDLCIALPDPACVFAADGSIMARSPAFEKWFGSQARDDRRGFCDVAFSASPDDAWALILALDESRIWDAESTVCLADGETVGLRWSVKRCGAAFIATAQDISQRAGDKEEPIGSGGAFGLGRVAAALP